MQKKTTERDEATARLREWLKPGDTVYCILRTVSRSGMSHVIDLYKMEPGEANGGRGELRALGYNAAAALGLKYDRDREGIKIGGAGMDMGFALVYDLGRQLWPDGFECAGEHCASNDHSNGLRDRTPGEHQHQDGGYALRHRWL